MRTHNIKTTVLHAGIFVLTLLTASAHLYLSTQPDEELRKFFFVNGLGYITLLCAFFLSQSHSIHRAIRRIFFFYVLLTITLWFFLGSPREGVIDPFDITVKLIEITLATFLFLDSKREPAPHAQ